VNDLSVGFKLEQTEGRESDSIGGAGVSVALNVKQVIEIDRYIRLNSFVGKRDNLIGY